MTLNLSDVQFEDDEPATPGEKFGVVPGKTPVITPSKFDTSSVEFADEPGDAPKSEGALAKVQRGFLNTALEQDPQLYGAAIEMASRFAPTPEIKKDARRLADKVRSLTPEDREKYKLNNKGFIDAIKSNDIETLDTWLMETLGSTTASSLPSLTMGVTGAAMAKRLGMGKFGTTLSGGAGLFMGSFAPNAGEAYDTLKEAITDYQDRKLTGDGQTMLPAEVMAALQPGWKRIDQDEIEDMAAKYALPAAGAMAALDATSFGPVVSKVVGIKELKREVGRRFIKRVFEEGRNGVLREGGTEAVQEAIKQAAESVATDKDFLSKQNAKDIIESGAAGAVGGVGPGVVAGAFPDRVPPQPKGLKVVRPPGSPINVPPTDPSQVTGQPPTVKPSAQPTPASSPQSNTGTATAVPAKPAEAPNVGNPASAPKESPNQYPKAEAAKKAGRKKKGAANAPVPDAPVIPPDQAAALAVTQNAETPVVQKTLEPETAVSEASESALDEDFDEETGEPLKPAAATAPTVIAPESIPPAEQGRRILADTSLQARTAAGQADVALAANLAASKPKEVKPGHKGKAAKEKRKQQNAWADEVVADDTLGPQELEDDFWSEDEGTRNVARQSMVDRARRLVAAAKEKGLNLKAAGEVFAENTDPEMNRNDAQLLLAEAARLARHTKPKDEDFARFYERERVIRSGDPKAIAELRSGRKAEGEAAKQVGSKGETDQLVATGQAWTEEEAARRESKSDEAELTPEVTAKSDVKEADLSVPDQAAARVKDKETGKVKVAKEQTADTRQTAKGEDLALTAQAADMESKEASVVESAKGPARLKVPTTKRGVKQATGEIKEEEVAEAATGDTMTAERKAKLIAEMNEKLKKEGAAAKPTPEVTSKVTPKVEAVKKKAEKKAEEKKAAAAKPKVSKEERAKQILSEQASSITKLPIKIKNLRDTIRSGVTKAGKKWSSLLKYHYGEIARTKGNDGDPIDVILGSLPPGVRGWYIVDQIDPDTQKFDEHKVLTGFVNAAAATDAYTSMFSDDSGPSRFGGMRFLSDEEFKAWLDAAPKNETVAPEQTPGPTAPDEQFLSMETFGPTLPKVRKLRDRAKQIFETGMERWRQEGHWPSKTSIAKQNKVFEYIVSLLNDAVDAMEIAEEWAAKDAVYAQRFTDVAMERLELAKEKWPVPLLTTQMPIRQPLNAQEQAEFEREIMKGIDLNDTTPSDIRADYPSDFEFVKANASESFTFGELARELVGGAGLQKFLADVPNADNLKRLFPAFYERIASIIGDNVRVYIVPDAAFNQLDIGAYGGYYESGADYIAFPQRTLNDRAFFLHGVLHEGVHAAFLEALSAHPESITVVDIIAREARDAANRLAIAEGRNKDVSQRGKRYAFNNIDEFIAEAFSNPAMQHALAQIPASDRLVNWMKNQNKQLAGRSFRTLWDALLTVAANALGIKTRVQYSLLDAVLHVGANLQLELDKAGGRQPFTWEAYAARTETRAELYRAENSPWSQAPDQQYTNNTPPIQSPISPEDVVNQVARRVPGAASTAERVWTKFVTLKQMARWYQGTVFGPALNDLTAAISAQMPQLNRFKKEASALAQEFIDWSRKNTKEAAEFASIGMELTYLEGNVVDGETGATILNHASNAHYGKSKARYWQGKAQLPALQERYNKLSPEAQRLFQKMQQFYRDTQNRMVTDTVTALLETAETAIPPAYLPGLITRVMNKEMNDTDKTMLNSTLYHALQKEAAFHKVKGAYFPSMRYGDYVVQTRDEITDTMGGTLVDGNKVVFRDKSKTKARKAAEAFVKKSPLKMTNFRTLYFDGLTGKAITADEATGKNDVEYGFEATMMTDGVYFFESHKAATDFAEDNPEGHSEIVSGVQTRIGQGYRASILSGTQMSSIIKSVEQRLASDPAKVDMIRAILTQSAARLMEGNRITSRRLKRRKVTGASKDFARNVLQYGEAAGKHIVTARAAPQIRAAMKKINDLLSNYEGKDKNRLVQIRNELDLRVQMGTLDPNKASQAVQDLLALSYFGRLFSAAYSVINATQVIMIGAPLLNGRFGMDRGSYAVGKAYKDTGFGEIVTSGLKNTWMVTRNFTKAGVPGTDDLLGNVKKKLASQPDGAALNRMIDALVESNDISETAGFEIEGSVAEGRGLWGKTLARVDRISRQLPLAVEVVNRTVMAVASYRLAVESGMNEEKAIQFARDMVDQSQFDYTAANQPRIFNKSGWRLAFQFKKYAQGVTYLLADLTRQAFKGASREERRIAQKQLGHIVTMQVLMAGTFGLPAIELIKLPFFLAGMLGLGDGWEEQEDYLRDLVNKLLGEDVGEALSNGVIPTTLGIDIQERVGMGNVWFFGEPDLTGTAAERTASLTLWLAQQAIGSGGMLLSEFQQGLSEIVDGENTLSSWLKGTGKLLPVKTVRDTLKGYERYLGGKADVYEFGANIAGFKSAKQAREGRQTGREIRARKQEEAEGKRLSAAYRSARTPAEKARVTAKIREHNKNVKSFKNRVSIKSIDKYRTQTPQE